MKFEFGAISHLRFRVTHHDKKLHGGPNPLVSSGDQLDQSQDSEERKEGGYNLRSMFKDVRTPLETSNGVAANVGKRRKSLTIFGQRRGSVPVGIKVGEGTGRETGGVKFAIQQQPVVQEELLKTENTEVTPQSGTKPGIKPETVPSKNLMPAVPQSESKTLGSVHFSSSPSKIQAHDFSPAPKDDSMIKPSTGSTAPSAPSFLPIPSPAVSVQSVKTTEKQEDVKNEVFRNKEEYDPGPQQTSTPIAPVHGSISGFTPVTSACQPEPCSSTTFPVMQTPPDPSSSLDLEPGFDASLSLIGVGSSPPSSFQIKTPSSVFSLKTPTSPLAVTPSPKLSSRNTPTEATKTAFSSALTPSPKVPSDRKMSSQSPIPSSSFRKSASPLQARTPSPALTVSPKLDTMPVPPQTLFSSPADQNLSFRSSSQLPLSESGTPVTSMTKGYLASSPLSPKDKELEGARIPKTEEKTEIKTVGILKTAKTSPVEGDSKVCEHPSSTDHLAKDRLSNLPLPPSSLLSPSLPTGSKMSNVTVVKASPDSKREFSVVTMVEMEEPSISIKDQKGETSESGAELEKVENIPTVIEEEKVFISGLGQPKSGETSEVEDRPSMSQEKDDMVEMEDIRDCKVTQLREAEGADEESEKKVNF